MSDEPIGATLTAQYSSVICCVQKDSIEMLKGNGRVQNTTNASGIAG